MRINECPENQCVNIDISNKRQFFEALNKIRPLTDKIIIVQIDDPIKNDPIVNSALKLLHLEKKEIVNKWFGTIAEGGRGAVKYTFSTTGNSNEFFSLLSSLNSFWYGIEAIEDEFDSQSYFDDIAFLDKQGKLLFFSTTHEDCFYLNKDLV